MTLTARDGVKLHYQAEGEGAAVIMLHSVGMHGGIWEPLVRRWAPAARAVALDFRGHGKSEVPKRAFSLEDLADDVADLIAQESDGPAVVVGLSLGGMVAQVLAERHPQSVRALVLADTNHSATPERARSLEERARSAETEGMAAALDSTIERWFTKEFIAARPEVIQDVRATLAHDDPHANASSWRAIAGLGDGSRLQGIRIPALVIVGAEDVSTPPEVGRELAARLPLGSYHEIAHAAHMSVMEQPEDFAEAVEAFLQQHLGWSPAPAAS